MRLNVTCRYGHIGVLIPILHSKHIFMKLRLFEITFLLVKVVLFSFNAEFTLRTRVRAPHMMHAGESSTSPSMQIKRVKLS